MPSIDARQAQLPSCVINCIGNVDIGSCSSLLDYACVCRDNTYQQDIASCFAESCTSADEQTGQQFAIERCAAVGIPITLTPSNPTATIGPSGISSSSAAPTTVEVTGTPAAWVEPPVLYEQTLLNIQAIMSSICLALLLGAIALGYFSCRARIRRERGQTASQWSGAGTFGDQTKFDGGASRFGMSRPGPTGQTDTFLSGVSDFRQTVSFSSTTNNLPYDRPRFTNRMTVEEEEEEEMEMKDRSVVDRKSDDDEQEGRSGKSERAEVIEEVATPTTATSGMDMSDGRHGSQEALNQVNVLDKQGRAL